jgi:hypothetical protein
MIFRNTPSTFTHKQHVRLLQQIFFTSIIIFFLLTLLFGGIPTLFWSQPHYGPEAGQHSDPWTDKNPLDPVQLEKMESNVYSKNGEDGILKIIFDIIRHEDKQFVEFNVGDGTTCNTRFLREDYGWKGLAMDPYYSNEHVRKEHVTKSNVCEIMDKYDVPMQLDLLSIAMKYQDYWVLKRILQVCHIFPRVIVTEINASLGSKLRLTVPEYYPDEGSWDYTKWYGASLAAMTHLLKDSHTLVYVERTGTHAFYVRSNLLQGFFLPKTDIDQWIETKHRYPRQTYFGSYLLDFKRRPMQEV